MKRTIVIGTRGSALALWQSEWVAAELRRQHPGVETRLDRIVAPADAAPDVPLSQLGTKGLFTKTIEDALLERRIDVAVHSMKDLASIDPPGLIIGAVPPREDPRDVLVASAPATLDTLPTGARIGTSSPRRRAQLRHRRPDLTAVESRGNVDTRLRKLRDGRYDALILAAAGLHRLGLAGEITTYIEPAVLLPAGGQGALAIQVRDDDRETRELVAALDDATTALCCRAERRVQALLEGGCRVPIGVLGRLDNGTLTLDAVVAAESGSALVRAQSSGPPDSPDALAQDVVQRLLQQGAALILQAERGL